MSLPENPAVPIESFELTEHSPENAKHTQTPLGAYRVTLTLSAPARRLDSVLIEALRTEATNLDLKHITRNTFKNLFKNKRIRIKGQAATAASGLAAGITFVDILGYGEKPALLES